MKFDIKTELVRLIPLVAAVVLIAVDDARRVVWFYLGVTLFFAYVSHLLRKLYFPYVDLKEFAEKAKSEPMSAAIVFASVTYLLATIVNTSISLLK